MHREVGGLEGDSHWPRHARLFLPKRDAGANLIQCTHGGRTLPHTPSARRHHRQLHHHAPLLVPPPDHPDGPPRPHHPRAISTLFPSFADQRYSTCTVLSLGAVHWVRIQNEQLGQAAWAHFYLTKMDS